MCLGTIGVVTQVWEEDGVPVALVRAGSATTRASLLACPGTAVGTSVLVHSGYVIDVLSQQAAADAQRLRSDSAKESESP